MYIIIAFACLLIIIVIIYIVIWLRKRSKDPEYIKNQKSTKSKIMIPGVRAKSNKNINGEIDEETIAEFINLQNNNNNNKQTAGLPQIGDGKNSNDLFMDKKHKTKSGESDDSHDSLDNNTISNKQIKNNRM